MTRAPDHVPPLALRLHVGVTGHRAGNPAYAANAPAIEAALGAIFDLLHLAVAALPLPPAAAREATRLYTLLVDGADQAAARAAARLGWELVAPLPFGRVLNTAINAAPRDPADARAILAGSCAHDPAVAARAAAIEAAAAGAQLFELAERDDQIAGLFLAALEAPDDALAARRFAAEAAHRAALAGKVLIEQCDVLLAVWDGVSTAEPGGAGWTVASALDKGAPVIWIDPAAPGDWRVIESREALGTRHEPRAGDGAGAAQVAKLVGRALLPEEDAATAAAQVALALQFQRSAWRPRSSRFAHAYRRVEALFGGGGRPWRSLVQRYEEPARIASGSARSLAALLAALPGADARFCEAVREVALRNLARADGISARLSDAYRGGMTINFILSAFAIVGGVLYLPLGMADAKWAFALFEFALLSLIIAITLMGQKRGWHARWFQTRRVAEYFRHSPLMLLIGAARAPGLWPRATKGSWPEWYVRQSLRAIGLPRTRVTGDYLRTALAGLVETHIVPQRDYHRAKAGRLHRVHHNLDRVSEAMFAAAVLSVLTYLVLAGADRAGALPAGWLEGQAKLFTVLGVMFPTFGAAIAGIRYFGDFERFAAISQVTAEKLTGIESRAARLLDAPTAALSYGAVAGLVHAADEVVVSEIESWQSVFGSKAITVPV